MERPATGRPRGVIYDRVSTLQQARHGYSAGPDGFQVDDCRKMATELGIDIIAEIRDTDSGADWKLDGFNRLLDMARHREYDILLCHDPDRLARNTAKQHVAEDELKRYGVPIRYVMFPTEDTAEGRLQKNVRAAVAEYEREKIAIRMGRGRRQKAKLGHYVGNGTIPYGYRAVRQQDETNRPRTVGLEIHPDTAPVVRRIWHDALHQSAEQIGKALTAERIPSPSGRPRWGRETILTILRNETYTGRAPFGRRDSRGQPADAATIVYVPVPALVDQETWNAVHAAMDVRRKRRRHVPASGDPYLLRGLATCGHCGGGIACTVTRGDWRYYSCIRHNPTAARRLGKPVCPCPPIPIDVLNAHAWAAVVEGLSNREALEAGIAASRAEHAEADAVWKDRRGSLEREIKRLRSTLANLVLDRAEARRGGETWRALGEVIERHEATIARLTTERERLRPDGLPGLSPEAAASLLEWAEMVRAGAPATTPAERRRIVELMQLHAVVRHDPEHGQKLGRHAFTIEYSAQPDVLNNAGSFSKLSLLCSTGRDGAFRVVCSAQAATA